MRKLICLFNFLISLKIGFAQNEINSKINDNVLFVSDLSKQITKVDSGLIQVILSSGKNGYLLYSKKIVDPVYPENKSDEGFDMVSHYYLYDIKKKKSTLIIKPCYDGIGGYKVEYLDTGRYPFSYICHPSNFIFSPDETKIFFESRAWVVSNAIHIIDIKNKRIEFFSDGSINKVGAEGVYVLRTGNDYNEQTNTGGRYWREYLLNQKGGVIKPIGKKFY